MDAVQRVLQDVCANRAVRMNLSHLQEASILLDKRKRSKNIYTREAAKAVERMILKTLKLKLKTEI